MSPAAWRPGKQELAQRIYDESPWVIRVMADGDYCGKFHEASFHAAVHVVAGAHDGAGLTSVAGG